MVHKPESSLAFLLGAGFSVDASSEVGSFATVHYPLVSDLANACFGLDALQPGSQSRNSFKKPSTQGTWPLWIGSTTLSWKLTTT
jgi:hypothetical protein